MKKLLLLALVAAFVFGGLTTASATDIKVKGEYQVSFQFNDNLDFTEGDNEDDFFVQQRVRMYTDYIASENLKYTLGIEIGEDDWGQDGTDLGGDGVVIEVKRSVLQFVVPNTMMTLSIGLQYITLPGIIGGSPVFADDCAAAAAIFNFSDSVSLTAAWIRAVDANVAANNADGAAPADDEFDVFAAILPIALDGATVTPWAAYGMAGAASLGLADDITQWYAGVTFDVSAFAPIILQADLMYGAQDSDTSALETDGFWLDAAIGYKMDMMTPMLVVLYSSGLDDDGEGIMPTIDPSYGITTLGTDGATGLTDGVILSADGRGLMAIGLVLADISFVDGLTNKFAAVYYQGTSDEDAGAAIDEEDSAFEVNLVSTYSIYENLAATLDLAYVSVDLDANDDTEPAIKAGLTLKYSF